MSIEELRNTLTSFQHDDAVAREFIQIWPVVESILESFSQATKLPIFAYIGNAIVFQSSAQTMPPFCSTMLQDNRTAVLCQRDGSRRASKMEPDMGDRMQYCHAGMINGRREIDTASVGILTILFGAKPSANPEAIRRRRQVADTVELMDPALGARLRESEWQDGRLGTIEESDAALMDAIANILQRLLAATVSARALAINMAHELSLIMLGVGLLAAEMDELMCGDPGGAETFSDLVATHQHLLAECKLGLYVVRNFLSHHSETRYRDVVRPKFAEVRLSSTLNDMIDLYKVPASKKHIIFDVSGIDSLPVIRGSDMEIRRLLHNVLNNAVKYSYHSIASAQRTIRVRAKVPYDPGFRERRFAILVENYGLGLAKDERSSAFRPGFRGRQAIGEVPIGAGIGLSEALKIMKVHGGDIRLRSEQLHDANTSGPTFKTTVELIFPYGRSHERLRRNIAP